MHNIPVSGRRGGFLVVVLFTVIGLVSCGSSQGPVSPTSPVMPDPPAPVLDGPMLTVPADQAQARIRRKPFRLEITDAQGAVALSQVENSDAGPMPIVSVAEPAPLGGELPKTPTLYAPLFFVVGITQTPQLPAGPWAANVATGTAVGIAYHATEVLQAMRQGSDTLLTLATNDPTGRVLRLTLSTAEHGGLRVRVQPDPTTGVVLMGDSFVAAADDAFRGFGGRHNALDQRGQDFLNWVQQQNLGAGQGSDLVAQVPGNDDRYMFPNGKTAAYYVAPQFIAPRYGFLLERDELARWRMASDRPDAWQLAVAGTALDYSVRPGAPPQTIAALTAFTGRHPPPPDWALGPILDRATIAFTQTAAQYEVQVRDDLAQLDTLRLPTSGYRIEGWFQLDPVTRAQLIAEFKRRGIRVLTYFRPFTAPDRAGTEDPEIFNQALSNGYLAGNAAGVPYFFLGNFFGPTALIDFTKPDAVTWWQARIRSALEEGADGFMQDFGEQTFSDMVFADGRSGAEMHNRYPALFHRITREEVTRWEQAHPQQDKIWFFTRAGYAGLDGSARYEGANFAGDGNTDFSPSSGLAAQTPDMLNRGLAGAYGFTTDIGGYFDYVSPATTKELLIRWAQWAVFSPYMRLHGSITAGTHMPWNYDEETVAIWRQLSELRLRAVPYLKRAWAETQATGLPLARPLWLAFPGDAEAAKEEQQWLLGSEILVAPVVTEAASARSVYFPQGCWQHGETGARFTGPSRQEVAAPLASLPWFYRCGASPLGG